MNVTATLRGPGRAPALAAVLLALAAAARPARADVSLPNIFGSHMVLQQQQKDKVWGTADPGEEVTVKVGDQSKTATADEHGKWSVTLDPMPAGGPHQMIVSGKNTVTFDDVLVGEVWLCSGQSNMEWPVNASYDGDLAALSAKHPHIRLITVPKKGTQEPQDNFDGRWEVCTPETVKGFSAVGYFFGRQLHDTLGVPVGLIDDSWGGSACEAWVNRDRLKADEKYRPLLERWERIEKGEEKGDLTGNARPGNIYNGVLKPTIGYGIEGVIWYQGETNAGRAYQYRDLFPLMIQNWRDEWGIGDFPFYWVQLADFMAEKPEPGESAWAELREAQTMTLDRLPHTGQAVIVDLGEGKDIHPRDKVDVARRLARLALAHDYGMQVAHHSPRYKAMERQGDVIVLTFDHAGGGLQTFDVNQPRGFTIAGADRQFVPARAVIVGKARDTILVWSERVPGPVAVRYGWADNPACNVYSPEHLPLTPFRTDDWPGVTAKNVK